MKSAYMVNKSIYLPLELLIGPPFSPFKQDFSGGKTLCNVHNVGCVNIMLLCTTLTLKLIIIPMQLMY